MFDLPLGAFHSSFCSGEEYKGDTEVQENFLSFDADLVAEQLTYMDAVSRDKGQKKESFGAVGLVVYKCFYFVILVQKIHGEMDSVFTDLRDSQQFLKGRKDNLQLA